MQISVHSSVGKQRKTNQDYADYFIFSETKALFVLCDGVGGHRAGEVASELTTKFLGDKFMNSVHLNQDGVYQWIHQSIHEVNEFIYQKSLEDNNLEMMGTTLIFALRLDEKVYIAHVGDSRAYVYNKHQLFLLTEDHSLINELIRTGEITREEGSHHPRRNIVTQSIGVTADVSYEVKEIDYFAFQILLLCSDGLTNMLSDQSMANHFQKFNQLDELGFSLVDAANQAGGTDNITVLLLKNQNIPESVGDNCDRY